jgi:hypothetical protein
MEMRECAEILSHQEQVHQLAVIWHQRVVAAERHGRTGPALVADAEREHRGAVTRVDFGCRGERPIADQGAIALRLGLPPGVSAPQDQGGAHNGDGGRPSRSAAPSPVWLFARRQHALANRHRYERQKAGREQDAQRQQDPAQPRRHRMFSGGQRQDRHDGRAGPRGPFDINRHLV